VACEAGVPVAPDVIGVAAPSGFCVATEVSALTNVPVVDEPSVEPSPLPVVLTGVVALTAGVPDVVEVVDAAGDPDAAKVVDVAGVAAPLGSCVATGASALTNVPSRGALPPEPVLLPVVFTGAKAPTAGDPDVPVEPVDTGANSSVRPRGDAGALAAASDSVGTGVPDAEVLFPEVPTGTVVPDNDEVVGRTASTGASGHRSGGRHRLWGQRGRGGGTGSGRRP
jgi:hypothetical protein